MFEDLLRRVRAKPESPSARKNVRFAQVIQREFGPPICAEERSSNLSDLERELNARMKCHAGKNQVFIRSLLAPTGTTQPRITLKCALRRDIGLKPEVFYEHIRDICCSDPEQCEAYRHFKDRFVPT